MIERLIGWVLTAGIVLFGIRFGLAEVGLCTQRGAGASMKTKCMQVLEFTGEGIESILTVKIKTGGRK